MTRLAVEILHTTGCGSWEAARDRVLGVAREEGVPIALEERLVDTLPEARAWRFPGSPTIRIDGRDLQPKVEARDDFGLG